MKDTSIRIIQTPDEPDRVRINYPSTKAVRDNKRGAMVLFVGREWLKEQITFSNQSIYKDALTMLGDS